MSEEMAFPSKTTGRMGALVEHNGMTLRDWFAGQVLAGMWANPNVLGEAHELAKGAYAAADAMLAERVVPA